MKKHTSTKIVFSEKKIVAPTVFFPFQTDKTDCMIRFFLKYTHTIQMYIFRVLCVSYGNENNTSIHSHIIKKHAHMIRPEVVIIKF